MKLIYEAMIMMIKAVTAAAAQAATTVGALAQFTRLSS